MSRIRVGLIVVLALIASLCFGQIDKFNIGAGTPEDKDLTAIGNESDSEKKIPMYQEFTQKYSANPVAAAYANWQLSLAYQSADDLEKALAAGDKALASSPRNMDVLTSQVTIARQANDNPRAFKYAIKGGEAFNSIEKQPKPAGVSDDQFKSDIQGEQDLYRTGYTFFLNTAFNVIAAEKDAKIRMNYVDTFSSTFPKSTLEDQVVSYAMMSLAELGDTKRLIAYGDKVLAKEPDNLGALITLASTYVDSPATSEKAISYAQKAILAAKLNDPNSPSTNKVSAGIAHCVMGRAYANQGKTTASIAELKSATTLLKGNDEQNYAVAAYFLGWDYAKLNKLPEAREVLTDAAAIPGQMQAPIKDLLGKVNSAKAAGK